jgi:cysteine desulfurase
MKIGGTLYFDHQATTPVDVRVVAAMAPYFSEKFGNPHSVDHVLGWDSAQAVDAAAANVATLIGADPDEIIFLSGATEANNLALLGLARRASGGERHRILITAVEHKSVLAVGRILSEQLDIQVEILGVDNKGSVLIPELEHSLDTDVLAVSVMAVNNEIGTIQNIGRISELAHDVGAVLHTDAAQAPCAIDMKTITQEVDLLSMSSHKMYGPKGIGVLFVRRELQINIEPIIYGGGQQNNLRSGTIPTALCVGLGTAAKLLDSPNAEGKRELLRQQGVLFLDKLRRLSWPLHVNGPEIRNRHPGNINVQFEGFSARDILGSLQPKIAASTGSACTTGSPEPSHVLNAIGLSDVEADSSIRFSFGRNTTDDDVNEAVNILDQTLLRLHQSNMAEAG